MAISTADGGGTPGEFRRGWTIVLCSMIGISLGLAAMPIYTIGVFAPHLARAFDWSMGEIMAGISVTTIALLVAGPLAGWLSGRFGVRRVVLCSQLLFGLSFMGLAFSTGSLTLYYANWALITLAGAGTLPITFTYAVNRWFEGRRGLALGLAMMGTGLFGILCKPLLAWAIPEFGWRGAYIGLGLLPIVIALPVSLAMMTDASPGGSTGASDQAESGLTLRQALREWRFWLLACAILPISIVLGGPVPNMENLLGTVGIDAATIVGLTPLIGLSALLGRMVGGWLIDRLWAPLVGFVILSLPAISCVIFTSAAMDPQTAAIGIFLIGFALGIEYDLIAYLVARYFGMRAYSSIYALLYVFFSLGAGTGPLLMGADFDRHGSYDLSLGIGAVLLVVAAASLLLLGKYRSFGTG